MNNVNSAIKCGLGLVQAHIIMLHPTQADSHSANPLNAINLYKTWNHLTFDLLPAMKYIAFL